MPRIRFAYLFLLAAGCSFNEGGVPPSGTDGSVTGADAADNEPDGAGPPDARVVDADLPDAMEPCAGDVLPFEPLNVGRCGIPDPGAAVNLTAGGPWGIDTDTGVLFDTGDTVIQLTSALFQQPGGAQVRVVAVDSWSQTQDVYVFGALPLVLVSFGDVDLDGSIIVWADEGEAGSGGDIDCDDAFGDPGVTQAVGELSAGSGGGGGGFGSVGGGGAKVHNSAGSNVGGGMQSGNPQLVPLRGGCSGGVGGSLGGPGGGGGGAIQVVAAGAISVGALGAISAPGGGGAPPQPAENQPGSRGGGGGGSGGAILLQSTTLTIAAGGALTAQGGGGGEGTRSGGDETVGAGDSGAQGSLFTAAVAAGGADPNCSGGDGGPGAIQGVAADDGSEGASDEAIAAGGGGGGGGVGRIRLVATTTDIDEGAVISPAAP